MNALSLESWGEEQIELATGKSTQLSQFKLIDDMVCLVLRDQGLELCRETNTHDTLPLRVKVLFLPASEPDIPTSTFFLLLA